MTSSGERGLQQERTVLAWRRTGLALAAGSLVVARLLLPDVGPALVVPGLVAAALAVWVVRRTVHRGRHAIDGRGLTVLRDGRIVAAVSLALGLLAVAEIIGAVVQLGAGE